MLRYAPLMCLLQLLLCIQSATAEVNRKLDLHQIFAIIAHARMMVGLCLFTQGVKIGIISQ